VSTALILTTCGRRLYLERSLESLHEHLGEPFEHRIIVDDSGDATYGAWLRRTFAGWTILHHGVRAGLGAAVESAWDAVRRTDARWVFHTEDDFTFLQRIPLKAMREALSRDSDLAQVTLYRQPWSPAERVQGGYLNDGRWTHTERVHGFELHTDGGLFSFNPTMYRRKIVDDCVGGLEADVTRQLPGWRFGVLSGPAKTSLCWHIGAERSAGWSR
jgi:glycosyltransferase involved in cell wall biosynthesis